MEGLGITYDWLRSIRPDIIMLRIPAYGSTGPYNQARALGVHLESVMGHTAIRGYSDLDPTTSTPIFSGDYLAGAQAAFSVLLALWQRRKTGRGQLIELAQAETASAMLFQGFMDYLMNQRVPERLGNRSISGCAPAGVYPCLPEGPASECGDRWIAIEVVDDRAWAALVGVMGSPAWALEEDLATVEGRRTRHDFLDEQIGDWTKDFEDYDLFHRLQEAGVASAPVVNSYRIMDDEHVRARGLYEPQILADGVGPYRFTTPVFRFSETPITVRQPPVALGEHNEYVYREVIGVSEEEFERYRSLGHVATDFRV
ncbi:MAG: CaiB/BaiF CoA transferase family protein, partial [Dehalococcoidia bacterium]